MTEAEWLAETDFTRHVRFVQDRLGPRKLRLLAAAFCRAAWHLTDHQAVWAATVAVERFADRQIATDELEAHRQTCRGVASEAHESYVRCTQEGRPGGLRFWVTHELAWAVAFAATTPFDPVQIGYQAAAAAERARTGLGGAVPPQTRPPEWDAIRRDQSVAFRGLVWDVAGNPFRPAELDPHWRTGTAVSIARGMYEAHDFSAMPILADALQDAGCDGEAVLAHCREPGVHVRGCWVVDLVLGKG